MIAEPTGRTQATARLSRALTVLAFASLVFDIVIAVVTSVGVLNVGDLKVLLVPKNYALTVVVILSAVVFVTLLVEKAIPSKKA